jgi:hypothetical protein
MPQQELETTRNYPYCVPLSGRINWIPFNQCEEDKGDGDLRQGRVAGTGLFLPQTSVSHGHLKQCLALLSMRTCRGGQVSVDLRYDAFVLGIDLVPLRAAQPSQLRVSEECTDTPYYEYVQCP